MRPSVILASSSEIRKTLLTSARVEYDAIPARVDEDMARDSLLADGASPRDIADALAELKALKISEKNPQAIVIGCDQVLDFEGRIISKCPTKQDLHALLFEMRGKRHDLLSAVVICEAGQPVWRHCGKVRMTMRTITDSYLDDYIERNWDNIRDSVGGYKLEEEGVRLFANISGDYFTVLGLPLVELLFYLGLRGVIDQ
ncbi:Maf family protein [Roseovarius sp. 2305UL8-3]|uniref:Maf family protein n=1 Tax=Roseovarius conchicola TaxID=3121636 RepID=UPI00352845C3